MHYLNQQQAIQLDKDLMGPYQYSLVQLMEIAGLAVAQVVCKEYPSNEKQKRRVLIACGPGNNGGDGLVAARYLQIFGYDVTVLYPKHSSTEHLQLLVKQLETQGIPVVSEVSSYNHDLVIDAIFGFSFKGPIRGVFTGIIERINALSVPIVSVDIPSGWDVEKGYVNDGIASPAVLISLSAPKEGVRSFTGCHYLGGRFIPQALKEAYGLELPYEADELVHKIN